MKEKFFSPSPKKTADKSQKPEETIRTVEEAFRKSGLKIFRELRRMDKGRLGIPVYISIYDLEGRKITGNYKQMGKGTTDLLSRASALMELVERFSLFDFVKNRASTKLATLAELGPKALSPEDLLSSVEDPEEDPKAREVVLKVLPEVPFYFVPALEVARGEVRELPFFWFWILYEFNGSAAGNTYPEAAVQATCELIERHVSALSTRLQSPMPEIRRASIRGEADQLCRCFEKLGIRLWIRDMTFGMPAPTIAAMAMDPSTYPHRSEIVYASGTGTSPERALIRTLTEIAQLAGDFDTEGRYVESALPKFATLEEASYVLARSGEVDLEELPNVWAEDHVEELRRLAEGLKGLGYDLYLVDITHPALGVPAVYAIVPGLLFRERTRLSPLYQLVRTAALYLPPQESLPLLKFLSEEAPARYYVFSYLGQVWSNLGKHSAALSAFKKALELEPEPSDRPALYAHLADLYLALGEYEKARCAAEEGLTLAEMAELWNLLGRACFKEGQYEKALQAFLRAVELEPSSAVDYANVGYCLKELGIAYEARRFFEMALSLDPTLKMAQKGLKWCQEKEVNHV